MKKYIPLIPLIVVAMTLFMGCSVKLITQKRPLIDSANIFIFSSTAYGASGFSDLPKSYKSYKKMDNKIVISEAQVNRFKLLLKEAEVYYLIEGIVGCCSTFMQGYMNGKEKAFYFYSHLDEKTTTASIYDIESKRLYKVKGLDNVLFLYDLGCFSQNNSPAWLNMQVFVKNKYGK